MTNLCLVVGRDEDHGSRRAGTVCAGGGFPCSIFASIRGIDHASRVHVDGPTVYAISRCSEVEALSSIGTYTRLTGTIKLTELDEPIGRENQQFPGLYPPHSWREWLVG